MKSGVSQDGDSRSFPSAPADRVTQAIRHFLAIEAGSGVLLLVATLVALLVANSGWSSGFAAFWAAPVGLTFGGLELVRSTREWLNDGLMTLFFFVVALELKREFVVGELAGMRRAALPLAGALGGMLVPSLLFLLLVGDAPGAHGWGVVMATDTAFVIGCLAVLSRRVPASLRIFLLSLAIFDDVGAILVVAVGYGGALDVAALLVAAGLIAVVATAAWVGIRSVPVYALLGVGLWGAFDASGLHPTIAGVVLGLMTPARGWVSDDRLHTILGRVLAYPKGDHWSGDTEDRDHLQQAGRAAREVLSPVERLEILLHPWTSFLIMPAFALANAGVTLSSARIGAPIAVAIAASLVVGKPLGVLAFAWASTRLGLTRKPTELSWPVLAGGAMLTGIGFTMSLFIAGLAFSTDTLNDAKLGILAGSVFAATWGLLTLGLLARKRAPVSLSMPARVA